MARFLLPLGFVPLVLAAFVLLTACSKGRDQTEAAGDQPVAAVRIATIATPYKGKPEYSGLTSVVISDGWLENQLKAKGIRLEWTPVSGAVGGPMINEGFANKSIEFASYGDLPTVIANAAGVETRLVLPSNVGGSNVYVIVPKGSAYRTIEDLKGARIAIHRGRPWEAVFSRLLQSKGLSFKDFKILNINPPAGAAALASGKVDAVVALPNDSYRLVDQGLGRVLWSSKEGPESWRMRAELFGRRDFLEAHPDIAITVAAAYLKAAQWASKPENQDAYIALSARSGVPESVIRRDLEDPRPWKDRFSPRTNPIIVEHYQAVADYAFANGLTSKALDVKPILEPTYVEPALKAAGLSDYWGPAS